MKAKRGRPKLYDEDSALLAAGAVFWTQGYSGTSLDDLSEAMGMNRPSIYRAFGDKQAIYRKALEQFCAQLEQGFANTMLAHSDIRHGLTVFYVEALKVYTGGPDARGCMVMCTAPAVAISHPEVRADLLAIVQQLDQKFADRIETAIAHGQIAHVDDVSVLSQIVQAVLHSLAIRSRAGQSKASLKKMASVAVATLFPSPVLPS